MLPSVLVKGGNYAHHEIVGYAEVEAAGGQAVSIPVVEGFSTTTLVDSAQKIRG